MSLSSPSTAAGAGVGGMSSSSAGGQQVQQPQQPQQMFVGLELLYQLSREQVRRRCDALVLFTHWKLISKGFRCIGGGEAAREGEVMTPTELLPEGWSSDPEVYVLRYVMGSTGYLLKAIIVGEQLLFNFMRRSDEFTTSTSIVSSRFVHLELSSFATCYEDLPGLDQQLTRELLTGLVDVGAGGQDRKVACNVCTSNSGENGGEDGDDAALRRGRRRRGDGAESDQDPLRVGPPRYPQVPRVDSGGSNWPSPLVPPVGRGDLDPLGSGLGGGMLMDPNSSPFPGRGIGGPPEGGPGGTSILPRGSIPPGARFDPFYPDLGRGGRGGRRGGPDPDHLPPPGADDMFM